MLSHLDQWNVRKIYWYAITVIVNQPKLRLSSQNMLKGLIWSLMEMF